jgi:hypothetical protein
VSSPTAAYISAPLRIPKIEAYGRNKVRARKSLSIEVNRMSLPVIKGRKK